MVTKLELESFKGQKSHLGAFACMNQLSVLLHVATSLFLPNLGDLYPENDKDKDTEEPDWVKTEREHFTEFRDKNKDGKMDRVCPIILQSLKYCHTF